MPVRTLAALALIVLGRPALADDPPGPVSKRAMQIRDSAFVFDGHNDLPWRLRAGRRRRLRDGSTSASGLDSGQTDIPRAREGGLKAQFWSVYIPSDQPHPARTVTDQIDLVRRMVERYPDDLEIATDSADDVERIVKSGKIASLIGIEGGRRDRGRPGACSGCSPGSGPAT